MLRKRDNYTRTDLCEAGESIGLSRPVEIIEEVLESVGRWPDFAHKAGLKGNRIDEIRRYQRYQLVG